MSNHSTIICASPSSRLTTSIQGRPFRTKHHIRSSRCGKGPTARREAGATRRSRDIRLPHDDCRGTSDPVSALTYTQTTLPGKNGNFIGFQADTLRQTNSLRNGSRNSRTPAVTSTASITRLPFPLPQSLLNKRPIRRPTPRS